MPSSPGQERKLVVWSDCCIWQNNKWNIPKLYRYLISSCYFIDIEQMFLIAGDSFLPSQTLVLTDWEYIIANAELSRNFTTF
ncbi:hypothetical protein PR048_011088 [Dryococelus australis]|uniref:Uncharacterized protein n=1 Tax=Dryococelus australis TaxID=614101 RepID=A0ABQ9HKM8_9NEOP|nr:hypothetical protein PR048_011088 [Dryococelus australis]